VTRVAITGGIACGKSLAGTIFSSMGWVICEADTVAHALYKPGGAAYASVCKLAGDDAVLANGEIDRRVLGAKAFGDPSLLGALNRILHPLVREHISEWFAGCEADGALVGGAIVPLLFEAEMATGWDGVVCMGCDGAIQRERLRQRGLGEADIAARLTAQWPLERKMKLADFPVWNNGSVEELRHALTAIDRWARERKRQ
jgi:dephospho-CoA kinase